MTREEWKATFGDHLIEIDKENLQYYPSCARELLDRLNFPHNVVLDALSTISFKPLSYKPKFLEVVSIAAPGYLQITSERWWQSRSVDGIDNSQASANQLIIGSSQFDGAGTQYFTVNKVDETISAINVDHVPPQVFFVNSDMFLFAASLLTARQWYEKHFNEALDRQSLLKLEAELRAIDPQAFSESESYWPAHVDAQPYIWDS